MSEGLAIGQIYHKNGKDFFKIEGITKCQVAFHVCDLEGWVSPYSLIKRTPFHCIPKEIGVLLTDEVKKEMLTEIAYEKRRQRGLFIARKLLSIFQNTAPSQSKLDNLNEAFLQFFVH